MASLPSTSTATRRALFCATPSPRFTTVMRAAAPPALALARREADQMSGLNPRLIEEAIFTNHVGVHARKTLKTYATRLDHFDEYLVSVHGVSLLTAKRSHIQRFMNHLRDQGGAKPDDSRRCCAWCRTRGYPDGRSGCGWSASYRKACLAAIRFLYRHCIEEELLAGDPSALMKAPEVKVRIGWTPTEDQVRAFLDGPGRAKDRFLAYWMYYAPSRRQTFSDARWGDFYGLDEPTGHAVWRVVGKGEKPDEFRLHPLLRVELLRYRRWQQQQAERNPAMRAALSCEETAWVMMTHTGKKTQGQALAKMIQRRAVRAGVGVRKTTALHDSAGGVTSRLTPHALRRAWATHALNHPDNPVPLDQIQHVLAHADISTTRRHYAPTKPELAQAALVTHRI